MLREVIDIASLEDFVSGLARAAGLRVCIYDGHGELIVASAGSNEFARLTGHVLGRLPGKLDLIPVPAHDPPGCVAFVESRGVWYVVAPVFIGEKQAGFVGIGEFRDGPPADDQWDRPATARALPDGALRQAWEALPLLDRRGQGQPVTTARWGARQLAEWAHRESRLSDATREVALVGDVAELLTGQQDLQSVLDRIVAGTARVMGCPFCSMRLYDPKTDELTIKAVYNLPAEYLGKGAVLRSASALDDEALRGRIVYIEDAARDPRLQYPEVARRHGIVSVLTAGMMYRGGPVGVLRVYTDSKRRFRKAQRDLLRAVAYQAATALVHAQLIEERLRNAATERQLELAGDLQSRVIRTPPPYHPRLETALVFEPSWHVAGDFCDFLSLADGRLAAVTADVVGKGVPASLLMSTARGALRALAACRLPATDMMAALNRLMCRDTTPSEFVTLLLVAVDAEARQLTYCNAGHEPPLVLRDGEVLAHEEGDLVLGVNPDEVYHEHEVPLRPGDFVLLYTDGAVEARDFEDHEFGRERLRASLVQYGPMNTQQVLNNILWDIRRFVGLAEQSDDLTLVGLRVLA